MLNRILVIALFIGFVIFLLIIGIRNRINKEGSIGKPPINKYLFLLAKFTMIIPWLLAFLKAYRPDFLTSSSSNNINLMWFGIISIVAGFGFVVAGYIYLGKYTKFGLPTNESKLITSGIYRYSRNPMYVGLFLMLIGSVFYFIHWITVICSIVTIVLHYRITLSEEKHLANIFGKDWEEYKVNSKRYL